MSYVTIPGATPLPIIRGQGLEWLTWTDGEGSNPLSRGAVRLDDVIGYHTTGEDAKAPTLHLHIRSGAVIAIAIEEPDDAWQAFIDFTEQLDKILAKGDGHEEG